MNEMQETYTGKYLIAERVIEVNSLHPNVHRLCASYSCDNDVSPDFSVTITSEDIVYERKKSVLSAKFEGHPPYNWSDGYLEELAVYRAIAERILDYGTFLMHGSVVAVDGVAYLFTAKSGTGKSTHTALWRQLFGERAVMINDDKPLIKASDDGVTVFGTPYNGKHRLGENTSAPLKAICILERADENTICEQTKDQVYPMLIQQIYRPRRPDGLAKTLAVIDKLAENVRFFRLGCNMDIDAARVAYNGMNEPRE